MDYQGAYIVSYLGDNIILGKNGGWIEFLFNNPNDIEVSKILTQAFIHTFFTITPNTKKCDAWNKFYQKKFTVENKTLQKDILQLNKLFGINFIIPKKNYFAVSFSVILSKFNKDIFFDIFCQYLNNNNLPTKIINDRITINKPHTFYALPGGKKSEADNNDPRKTAIREFTEELSPKFTIKPEDLELIGKIGKNYYYKFILTDDMEFSYQPEKSELFNIALYSIQESLDNNVNQHILKTFNFLYNTDDKKFNVKKISPLNYDILSQLESLTI